MAPNIVQNQIAKRGEAKRGETKRGEAKRGEAKRGEAKRGEAKRGETPHSQQSLQQLTSNGQSGKRKGENPQQGIYVPSRKRFKTVH
jgi:hypothetical protein